MFLVLYATFIWKLIYFLDYSNNSVLKDLLKKIRFIDARRQVFEISEVPGGRVNVCWDNQLVIEILTFQSMV